MNRLAVYTALTRNYDTLRQPETIRSDADYFCFSNDIQEERIGAWRVRPIPPTQPNGIRLVRFVKLNPELFLGSYDACLWIDSNIVLTDEIQDRAFELSKSGVLLSTLPHSARNSVYDEGLYLLRSGIGDSGEVLRQIRHLVSEKFPDANGLKETCIFYRRHSDPKVVKFDRIWWSQLESFSTRDQLGCDYALWKSGLDCVPFSDPSILKRCQRRHNAVRKSSFPRRIVRWAVRMVRCRIAMGIIGRGASSSLRGARK